LYDSFAVSYDSFKFRQLYKLKETISIAGTTRKIVAAGGLSVLFAFRFSLFAFMLC
jgi:hypothetical protein